MIQWIYPTFIQQQANWILPTATDMINLSIVKWNMPLPPLNQIHYSTPNFAFFSNEPTIVIIQSKHSRSATWPLIWNNNCIINISYNTAISQPWISLWLSRIKMIIIHQIIWCLLPSIWSPPRLPHGELPLHLQIQSLMARVWLSTSKLPQAKMLPIKYILRLKGIITQATHNWVRLKPCCYARL